MPVSLDDLGSGFRSPRRIVVDLEPGQSSSAALSSTRPSNCSRTNSASFSESPISGTSAPRPTTPAFSVPAFVLIDSWPGSAADAQAGRAQRSRVEMRAPYPAFCAACCRHLCLPHRSSFSLPRQRPLLPAVRALLMAAGRRSGWLRPGCRPIRIRWSARATYGAPLHAPLKGPGTLADLPDPVHGPGGQAARQQTLEMGVGPMLHRSYAVRITGSSMTPAALVDLVAERLNQVSPEMAIFRKTRGRQVPCAWAMSSWSACPARGTDRCGSCAVTQPPSGSPPWTATWRQAKSSSGPSRTATASASRSNPGPGPGTGCGLLYNRLRLAKEIQLYMWSHFCVRTAPWPAGVPRAASPSAPAGSPGPTPEK